MLRKVANSGMLQGAGHNQSPFGMRFKRAAQGKCRRLGSARAENKFSRGTTRKPRHAFARAFHLGARRLAKSMHAAWIAPVVRQRFSHRLHHFRKRHGGGVVVQVDHITRVGRSAPAANEGTLDRSASQCESEPKKQKIRPFGSDFLNADERNRTSMGVTPQEPESCASANFATSARAWSVLRRIAPCIFTGHKKRGGRMTTPFQFKHFSINPRRHQ